MNRFLIFPLVLLSLGWGHVFGQMYNTTAGIRLADDVGFSVSQRLFGKTTAEVALQPGFFQRDMHGHLLLRRHYSLITKRLNFFLGAGVSFRDQGTADSPVDPTAIMWGGGMQGGAELTIGRFHVALDYTPSCYKNQLDSGFLWKTENSVSLRYVFWKRSSRIKSIFRKK